MSDSFLTISSKSEGFYKEKGSKFISLAFPVINEIEIKTIQEELRKEYYDARHHCYAYMLGSNQENYRANDDGEPAHSAGDPILGQIRAKNLTNTLVVVIRYFGGTKLGVGGLISAYKIATEEALNNASIIEKYLSIKYSFQGNYEDYNSLLKLTKLEGFELQNQAFEDDHVKLQIEIYKRDQPEIDQLVKELYNSKFEIVEEK